MKTRRILAFILMVTILLGNTMSVSATASSVSENEIVNVETEEVVEEEIAEEDVEEENEILEEELAEGETEGESVSANEPLEQEGLVAPEPLKEEETTSTDKVINRSDVLTVYTPTEPRNVSHLSYSFKSDADEEISSLNEETAKYRLLLFAPVEAYKNYKTSDGESRDLWADFYLNNQLLHSSSHVDTVVLDTGRSTKDTVKKIHTAAKNSYSNDRAVYCYDTTESEADNVIWQAYNAYCDLFAIPPATHWVDYNGNTTPCATYFLINEKNQIILYGYGDIDYYNLLTYIQDNAFVKPTAPTDIVVTNKHGEVTFSWTMADEANRAEAYTVMLDEDGNEIVDDWYNGYFKYDGKTVTYIEQTDTLGDKDNPTYRFQFREIYGNDYQVKSEYSKTYTNEGMECERNPEVIKEVRFIDTRILDTTGRKISAEDGITIHVGETVKMDIEIERYSTDTEKPDKLDTFRWYMSTSENGMSGIIKEGGPVKYWVESLEDMTGIYVKGEELTEATTYYMVCYYSDSDYEFSGYIIVPVHVVAAEPGVTYDTQETEAPADLYTSLESLREGVTTHLKNGDEEFTIAVNDDDWDAWDVSVTTLEMPQAFWDEEPWVLNYGYIWGGTIWSPTDDDWDCLYVEYKTDDYRIYKYSVEYDDSYGGFYAPYEWFEGQVDKLVNQPGGALYEYKTADEYTRIKAVYDWVRKNVSYIGTTNGLYHSAYGAMKTKKATCEGYQQITYRLLWEMGIPNGCMTDNFKPGDPNVHAYNMVKLEGKAYYLDTSAGKFLKGTKSEGSHDYQDFFVDNCQEYIDILSEDDYVYVPKHLQLSKIVDGTTTSLGAFNSFAKAKEAITEDITMNGEADSYSIFMTGDMSLSDDSLNNTELTINLDLKGYTLKVTKDAVSTAYIQSSGSKAGSIKVVNNAELTLVSLEEDKTLIGNVVFSYEGTSSALTLGTSDTEKVVLESIGTSTVNQLTIATDVEYTGSLSAQTLNWESGQITAEGLKVSGNTTVSTDQVLYLSGAGSFGDLAITSGTNSYFNIRLLRATQGSERTENGTLAFTGKLVNNTGNDKALQIDKYICDGEAQTFEKFMSGETIATITASTADFAAPLIWLTGDELYVEREGNVLKAARDTVTVYYYGETGDDFTSNPKTYSSLEKAIAGLATDFGSAKGSYNFEFEADYVLAKDVKIPAHVNDLMLYTESVDSDKTGFYSLDLNGYTLNIESKDTMILEGLQLINTGKAGSKINITAKDSNFWLEPNGSQTYVDAESNEVVFGGERVWFSNVDIYAPNTEMYLDPCDEAYQNIFNNYTYVVDGNITAKDIMVLGNTWKLNDITAPDFYVNDTIYEESEQGEENYIVLPNTTVYCDNLTVKDGQVNTDANTKLYVDKVLSLENSRFINTGKTYASKVEKCKNLWVYPESIFVCNSLTQATGGVLELGNDAVFVVNDTLTANEICTVQFQGDEIKGIPAYIYVGNNCMSSIQNYDAYGIGLCYGKIDSIGKVILNADGSLADASTSGTINKVDGVYPVQTIGSGSLLFTTNNKNFPVDDITVMQTEAGAKYNKVYQIGQNVYVGREWITISTKQVDGSEVGLQAFIRWSDAAAYLETLSNTSMEYVVEIGEDIVLYTDLTLPKKVKGITFRGNNPESDRITLTYTGDIKLATDTVFENIDLVGKKFDSELKDYQSAVTLNGLTLTLKNSSADFTSISGNNKSRVVLESAKVNVTKTVSSLGFLDMTGKATVSANGTVSVDTILSADSVTVTDTLTMQSAKIDCANKISLKNVISNDQYNVLNYGGNASSNGLTISGTISAANVSDMVDKEVTIRRQEGNISVEKPAVIRKNAIQLVLDTMETNGYAKDTLICNAEKAGAGWFIIGTKWNADAREITYGTYKNGKTVYCGEIVENVKLYSSSNENGTYAYECGFTTLQEALSEIDKLAVNSAYYRIEVVGNADINDKNITCAGKAPTFPSKAAGITIAKGSGISSLNLIFKGDLSLKSNTTFEEVTFVPQAKSTISLGNYSLKLSECSVDKDAYGFEFTGISGSNVNGTSALILDDTELHVAGNVANIGTLVFAGETVNTYALLRTTPAYPTLIADGSVSVGAVELEKDGRLTGLATVTRKEGKVTKIAPSITINKDVYSDNGNTLYLDLVEKKDNQFVALSFSPSTAMADICKAGIPLAKGVYVTYPNVKAWQDENTELVKAGSYLTYYEDGFGIMLSYMDETTGKGVQIPCYSFADAVTEINNQKTKRDYTITLQSAITEISGASQSNLAVPKELSMPNKSYVDTLTIQADSSVQDTSGIQLGFINNITLTSNVILRDVQFVQMIKNGSVYQTADFAKDDYPAAVTFNTAGYELIFEGENTFNTPLLLNGGNKGTLTFDEDGTITTLTNGFTGLESEVTENVIYGSITDFDTVNVDDSNLTLYSYKTSPTATSYTESKNKVTTLNVSGEEAVYDGKSVSTGNIRVVSDDSKAEFTCTNYNSTNGTFFVDGKVSLKNVSLEGDYAATIHADTNFDITGTMVSQSSRALLETHLKGAGKEPYLNVSATVDRVGTTRPIEVAVYQYIGAANSEEVVDLKAAAKNAATGYTQLLAAKSAQARDFAPSGENYSGGEYSAEEPINSDGYMMLRSNGKIYVYNGSKVNVAVYKGTYSGDEEKDELLGYYPSFKEASTDVDAWKDKSQDYTFVLTQVTETKGITGSIAVPVTITLPTNAKSVTVTDLSSTEGNQKIYLSGNVSLKCNTTFEEIEFAPINKEKGTSFTIAASGYDLALNDVTVSNELNNSMSLKEISGNGKQTVTLSSPALTLQGAISSAAKVVVKENIAITGNVKATDLVLENNSQNQGVTATIDGTITVDNLINKGTVANTLQFTRDSKGNSNVTINKEIINESAENKVVLVQKNTASFETLNKAANNKVTLSNTAKVMTLPKASTDGFVLQAKAKAADGQIVTFNGSLDGYNVVKADKGVYVANSTLKNDIVTLERVISEADELGVETEKESTFMCLDYSQAINEINNLADMKAEYTIQFNAAGSSTTGSNEIDTNVKDDKPYGTFPLPKSNVKETLMVKGIADSTSVVPFTGNISGQGTVTLQNLVLNPVKGAADPTSADAKISVTTDKTATLLTLDNVATKTTTVADAKTTGFIANISGTKNKTDVILTNCKQLLVKSGITNVNAITLEGTQLLSDGNVTVNTVKLRNKASWDSLGKMEVTDVEVAIPSGSVATSYIGSKQDKNGNSQFIVNGVVKNVAEGSSEPAVVLCKLYQADTTIVDAQSIFDGTCAKELTAYANQSLVTAKKAGADSFRAYPFRDASVDGSIVSNSENITKDNLVAYKDGVYVKNGNLNAMQIRLTEYDNPVMTAENVVSSAYAETFEDAVMAINNKADMGAYYKIQFTDKAPAVIMTAKGGAEFGALTLPTKAAGVTIQGYQADEGSSTTPVTIIQYTGALKASCDVTFENILLTEGSADKNEPDGFVESGTITPTPANNMTITFADDVYTYKTSVANSLTNGKLAVNAINAGKGHLVFQGNTVTSASTLAIGSITLLGGASFAAVGKVSVTDLYVDSYAENVLSSDATISIGNIRSLSEDIGNVTIHSDFTKINKIGNYGNSQLTISGLIENVNVNLNYDRYAIEALVPSYVGMDEAAYNQLLMKTDGKPDAYKKLATVPKASLDWITVSGDNVNYAAYDYEADEQTYLYKYDTGVYLTNLKPLVAVNGYNAPEENATAYNEDDLCYQAEFLTWEQAVKEIDKINLNERYYELILLDTIGIGTDEWEEMSVTSPISSVTMPSKAGGIQIVSEEGEQNGIFFTGTNVALKCPTYMENVGFTAVKKYTEKYDGVTYTYYAPITYTMNVGNFKLTQKDMVTVFNDEDGIEYANTIPYTISGSAKGIFELIADSNSADVETYAAIKSVNELIVDYVSAADEGDGYTNFTLDCLGDLNVKNITLNNSTVEAKNITVSTLATLEEARLQAGTSAANDGKMTLKDIQLADNGNLLAAEQNKSGATQITISGTVTETEGAESDALKDGTLEVMLYYNNYEKGNNSQKPAQLYDGMILCTAQKAASNLFVPAYTTEANAEQNIVGRNGMGAEIAGYGIYKSGKNICYGKTADTREVMLSIGDTGMATYFATFEEAVKEIDSLSLYKDPTAKVYEDYTITLLNDVEVGNEKKNNSYSSLFLPSKAKELVIDGNANAENGNEGYILSFNGNVNVKCNTKFNDITLYPIKNVKGVGVKTAVNYSIGNYTLELDNMVSKDQRGMSLIGNVSGSSKSGTLKLAAGAEGQVNDISISQISGLREVVLEESTQLNVAKDCSVYQLSFKNSKVENSNEPHEVSEISAEELPVLSVDGALTTTLISAENAGEFDNVYGIIRKPIASKMTVNGLYEDRDKDKVKEYYSLSFPNGVENGTIKVEVVGSPCPAGTLVLTGKNLNWDEIKDNFNVVSKNDAESADVACSTYTKGTNLYIEEKAE